MGLATVWVVVAWVTLLVAGSDPLGQFWWPTLFFVGLAASVNGTARLRVLGDGVAGWGTWGASLGFWAVLWAVVTAGLVCWLGEPGPEAVMDVRPLVAVGLAGAGGLVAPWYALGVCSALTLIRLWGRTSG